MLFSLIFLDKKIQKLSKCRGILAYIVRLYGGNQVKTSPLALWCNLIYFGPQIHYKNYRRTNLFFFSSCVLECCGILCYLLNWWLTVKLSLCHAGSPISYLMVLLFAVWICLLLYVWWNFHKDFCFICGFNSHSLCIQTARLIGIL